VSATKRGQLQQARQQFSRVIQPARYRRLRSDGNEFKRFLESAPDFDALPRDRALFATHDVRVLDPWET
jgi:hypothetical protein